MCTASCAASKAAHPSTFSTKHGNNINDKVIILWPMQQPSPVLVQTGNNESCILGDNRLIFVLLARMRDNPSTASSHNLKIKKIALNNFTHSDETQGLKEYSKSRPRHTMQHLEGTLFIASGKRSANLPAGQNEAINTFTLLCRCFLLKRESSWNRCARFVKSCGRRQASG
jgi:hypothetical protein